MAVPRRGRGAIEAHELPELVTKRRAGGVGVAVQIDSPAGGETVRGGLAKRRAKPRVNIEGAGSGETHPALKGLEVGGKRSATALGGRGAVERRPSCPGHEAGEAPPDREEERGTDDEQRRLGGAGPRASDHRDADDDDGDERPAADPPPVRGHSRSPSSRRMSPRAATAWSRITRSMRW